MQLVTSNTLFFFFLVLQCDHYTAGFWNLKRSSYCSQSHPAEGCSARDGAYIRREWMGCRPSCDGQGCCYISAQVQREGGSQPIASHSNAPYCSGQILDARMKHFIQGARVAMGSSAQGL